MTPRTRPQAKRLIHPGNGALDAHEVPRKIALHRGAVDAIEYRCRGGDTETGGPLFGYLVEDTYLIEYAVESSDRASRDSYSFGLDHAEIPRLEEKFRCPYLGDWHSHPGPGRSPYPSDTDRMTWGRKSGDHGLPWPSLIVWDDGTSWRPMSAFVTTFSGGKPRCYEAQLIETKEY